MLIQVLCLIQIWLLYTFNFYSVFSWAKDECFFFSRNISSKNKNLIGKKPTKLLNYSKCIFNVSSVDFLNGLKY